MGSSLQCISEEEDLVVIRKNTPFLLREEATLEISMIILAFTAPDFLFKKPWNPNELVDLLLKMIVITIVGVVSILMMSTYQRRKFRVPYQNEEFQELLDRTSKHVGLEKNFEVWLYVTAKPCLVTLSTLRFTAMAISEVTVRNILAQKENGEIVLAEALVDMYSSRRMNTWFPISTIMVPSFFMLWIRLSALDMKIALGIMGLVGFFALDIITTVIKPDCPSQRVLEIYGVHPTVSKIIVFRGRQPHSDEELKIEEEIAKAKRPSLTIFQIFLIDLSSGLFAFILAQTTSRQIFAIMPFIPQVLKSETFSIFFLFVLFWITLRIAFGRIGNHLNQEII
ncbi:MAG: hypothetical protein K9W43_14115 [Candidatus Thorarchaeota archaeon]|nr:hypothetical protein [Candidatus Thorarchaeota archaeon]